MTIGEVQEALLQECWCFKVREALATLAAIARERCRSGDAICVMGRERVNPSDLRVECKHCNNSGARVRPEAVPLIKALFKVVAPVEEQEF